jgi:hypothetical protein
MPIRRYVKQGVVFTLEVLSVMSNAFTAATEVLEIGGDERKREAVAGWRRRTATLMRLPCVIGPSRYLAVLSSL